MKLLNLGCGNAKIADPQWTNVDSLHQHFPVGTLEREQIDAIPNYIDADISKPLPFPDNTFDGCLLSHVLEHFDAQDGVKLLGEIKRVLAPHGVVLVSVPDTTYFRRVYDQDERRNQMALFGECLDAGNPMNKMFDAALWFNEHKVLLTEDALWAYMTRAGLRAEAPDFNCDAMIQIRPYMNRRQFSIEMMGVKL